MFLQSVTYRDFGIVVLLALSLSLPAAAHNGEVALAVPVEGIVIDGDFADWPEGLRSYAVVRPEWGVPPEGEDDISASFRIGYSAAENALYLAVGVDDQSTVVDAEGQADWNTQDGCEVYLDLGHTQSGPAMQFAAYGDSKAEFGVEGMLQYVSMAVEREAGRHQYEWRLDAGGLSEGKMDLGANMVLGLDVVTGDKDEDESFSWMAWGRGGSKSGNADRRGDVMLVGDYDAVGTIAGKVTVKGGEEVYAGLVIDVSREGRLAGSARTDEEGRYELMLLPGKYTFKPGSQQGVERFDMGGLEVSAGEETEVSFAVVPMPFLARLSFQIPEKGMAAFEKAYEEKIEPILKGHGLVLSTDRSPRSPGGVFSRLFELKAIAEMQEKQGALSNDSTLVAVLQDVEAELGVIRLEGEPSYHFEFFSVLAGPGREVDAGAGREVAAGPGKVTAAGGQAGADGWRSWTDGVAGAEISALAQDGRGNVWIGTSGGGVSRYDGDNFTTFTTADGLAHNWVRALAQDGRGNVWIGTDGGGVSRYDGDNFTTFTTDDGLAHNVVTALLLDSDGSVWIATEGGVSRYDGEHFTTFTTQDGLPSNWVASLLQDGDGDMWFGTEGGGVSRYDGQRLTTYNTRDGLPSNWVASLLQDGDGSVWIGTLGGVSRYRDARFTTLTAADGLGHDWVESLVQDGDGQVWVGTGGGVSRYDGKGFTTFTANSGLAHDAVSALVLDGEGGVWVGTEGGLSAYK